MSKKIVVINGKGQSGKDTLVKISSVISDWPVYNFSSVAIVKRAAEILGWEGTKKPEDRKFLSDLKKLSVNYNNQPNDYLVYSATEMKNMSLGFFHIREPIEISVFKSSFPEVSTIRKHDCEIVTLLVDRYNVIYGNESDDNVSKYQYDYTIVNDELSLLPSKVHEFLKCIGVPVNEDRYTKMCDTGGWEIRSSSLPDGKI